MGIVHLLLHREENTAFEKLAAFQWQGKGQAYFNQRKETSQSLDGMDVDGPTGK